MAVIGICPCRKLPDYCESVSRAGGEPRVLDLSQGKPEDWLAAIGGVLLTGGGDVNPALYGEAPHPSFSPAEEGRDAAEVALVRAALERGMPILAICRGVQVLNVAAGGSLVQDIPSQIEGALEHRVETPPTAIAHEVWVSPGSQLARILADRLSGDSIAVNSRHHQAVRRVAPGFVVSAEAPDGVVEAIEREGDALCLGVQWHPENFWRTGEFRPLFDALVTAADQRTR